MNDISAGNSLPLLNSERKELNNTIRQLREDIEVASTCTLHIVNCIITKADYLTEEQKTQLKLEIWK